MTPTPTPTRPDPSLTERTPKIDPDSLFARYLDARIRAAYTVREHIEFSRFFGSPVSMAPDWNPMPRFKLWSRKRGR